eukprot:6102556-Prymnesium_polylepis.1
MLYALGVPADAADALDRCHMTVAAMTRYTDYGDAVVDLRQLGINLPAPSIRRLYDTAVASEAA